MIKTWRNSAIGAQNFDQALAGAEADRVFHTVDAGGSKDWDADTGSFPRFNQEQYIFKGEKRWEN